MKRRGPQRSASAAAALVALSAWCGAAAQGNDAGPLATLARRAAELGDPGAKSPAGRAGDLASELAAAEEAIAHVERLAGELERDDSAYRVLFAIASEDDRGRTLDAASELLGAAQRATELVDAAALRADLIAELKDELAERLDRALQARQVVLPLLAARAALVIAALQPADVRAVWLKPAGELSASVTAVSPWAECEARVLAALSMGLALRRGDDPGPALALLDAASQTARSPECSAAVRERALIDADLSRSLVLRRARGPITARDDLQPRLEAAPWSLASGAPLPRALLGRDVLLSLALEESAAHSEGAQTARTLAVALDRYAALLHGLDVDARSALYAHLAVLSPALRLSPHDEARRLPSIMAMALAQGGGVDGQDAIDLLEYATNPDVPAPPVLRGDATLALAHRLAGAGSEESMQRAARLALDFSVQHADDARAAAALDLACRSAAAAEEATRRTPAHAHARSLLIECLRAIVGTQAEIPQREQWRLALAQALVNGAASASPEEAETNLIEAASALRPVADASRRTRAVVLMGEGWSSVLTRLQDEPDGPDPAGVKRCGDRLLALAEDPQAAFDASATGWTPPAAEVTLFRARALLALGQASEARTLVAPLWSDAASPASDARRALLVTLEASLALCEAEPAERAAIKLAVLDGAEGAEPGSTLRRLSDRAWRTLAPFAQPLQPDGPRPVGVCPDAFALAAAHANPRDRAGIENGRLGWALLLAGRGTEAAAQFERVLRPDDPSPPPALLRGLGEAHLANGDREMAFAAFRRAALASPADSADSWHAWTRLLDLMSTSADAKERAPAIRREIARLRALPRAEQFPVGLERLRMIEGRLGQPGGTGDGTTAPAVR